jgi:hypothetical protein
MIADAELPDRSLQGRQVLVLAKRRKARHRPAQ